SIESSPVARRLQRWGGQTCVISDPAVARALLPERTCHAVLIDRGIDAEAAEALGEAARGYAAQRIIMFTPAARHELQLSSAAASPFTGYLITPLRAASLAARLSAEPEVRAPNLAADAAIDPPDVTQTAGVAPAPRLSVLVAEDNEINALLMRSLLTRLGHQVVVTTNGEQAMASWLAAKSDGTPDDLVLIDVS